MKRSKNFIVKLLENNADNKDDTKNLYGYSLKTFIPQEEMLFNTFADAVITEAEKNKKNALSARFIPLSIIDNKDYKKVKENIVSNKLLNYAWRNFYSQTVIRVGVPYLIYQHEEYALHFSSYVPFAKNIIPESKDWKSHIVAALKFTLADFFENVLDSYNPKNHPMTKEAKDFFDWREQTLQLVNLENDFPEIKGTLL